MENKEQRINEMTKNEVYQRGLDDAWECARKVLVPAPYGCLSRDECGCHIIEPMEREEKE